MSRDICIFQSFLTPAHKAQITAAAEAAGMTPYFFTKDQFNAARDCVQHCEVLYAASPDLLRTAPATLKWYCASSAGVDAYCRDESLFANPNCLLEQQQRLRRDHCGAHRYGNADAAAADARLSGCRPGAPLGCPGASTLHSRLPCHNFRHRAISAGNIARRMRGMGAEKIIGLSRSGKAREAGIFDETYPISQLDRLLSDAELLVMALPNTPETVNILNRERIARLPKEAIVINVGRGNALDQAALAEALNTDHIAGAALDVVDPEPLPENDPLWDTKHLILTPHISGNLTLGYTCDRNVELFCEDLANYAAGRPLSHLVDRKRGY